MPIVECPHCHTKVGITEGTICPACRRDTANLSGVDQDKTTVWVSKNQRFPDRCIGCGGQADRTVVVYGHVSVKEQTSSPELGQILTAIFLSLLLPIIFLVRGKVRDIYRAERLKIKVPYCHWCESGPIEAVAVDRETNSFKILVHKEFAAELEESESGG